MPKPCSPSLLSPHPHLKYDRTLSTPTINNSLTPSLRQLLSFRLSVRAYLVPEPISPLESVCMSIENLKVNGKFSFLLRFVVPSAPARRTLLTRLLARSFRRRRWGYQTKGLRAHPNPT